MIKVMKSMILILMIFSLNACLTTALFAQEKDKELISQLKTLVKGEIDPELLVKDDFNQDGMQDIAGVSFSKDKEDENRKLFLALGKEGNQYQIAFLNSAFVCPFCGGMLGSITLSSKNGILNTSEMVGSREATSMDYNLKFEKGKLVFLNRKYDAFDRATGSGYSLETNYNNFLSTRSASNLEEKAEISSSYYNIISEKMKNVVVINGKISGTSWNNMKKITISEDQFVTYGKKRRKDSNDLSFNVRSSWDKKNLYFLIDVIDDVLVLPSASDKNRLIHRDHIELWFDQEYYVAGEYPDLTPRTKPNKKSTLQFGFVPVKNSSKVKMFQWYPKTRSISYISSSYKTTAKGYRVEIKIPLNKLRFVKSHYNNETVDYENVGDFHNLGFSVVVSDSDQTSKPKQQTMIATSQLKWGSPFHMGRLLLFNEYTTPVFPNIGY